MLGAWSGDDSLAVPGEVAGEASGASSVGTAGGSSPSSSRYAIMLSTAIVSPEFATMCRMPEDVASRS